MIAKETDALFDDFNCHIIYGEFARGWFIALPGLGICVEAAHPINYIQNMAKLVAVLHNIKTGKRIAEKIAEDWRKNGSNGKIESNPNDGFQRGYGDK